MAAVEKSMAKACRTRNGETWLRHANPSSVCTPHPMVAAGHPAHSGTAQPAHGRRHDHSWVGTALRAGRHPRRWARRRTTAAVGLSALVVAASRDGQPHVRGAPTSRPPPPPPPNRAAIGSRRRIPRSPFPGVTVGSTSSTTSPSPTRPAPAVLTAVEVLTPDGHRCCVWTGPPSWPRRSRWTGSSPPARSRLDRGGGGGRPRVGPGSSGRAAHAPDRLRGAGAPVDPGTGRQVSGPVVGVDPRAPVVITAAAERSRVAHREQLLRRLHHTPRRVARPSAAVVSSSRRPLPWTGSSSVASNRSPATGPARAVVRSRRRGRRRSGRHGCRGA